MPKKRINTEEFIEKAKEIHGDKYDYSKVNYKNQKNKVTIICPIHGKFEQSPDSHLNEKCGCSKCSKVYSPTTEEFIERCKIIHGNKYDYSKVNYINMHSKITIICPIHGEFEQIAQNHIQGYNCPICSSSKNEQKIWKLLNNYNINFLHQHKFDDCINKLPLPFDFYLPNYNICIEYDGQHHFIEVEKWGGKEKLKKRQKLDNLKTNYCIDNNIPLIRINYKEDVENKLIKELKNYINFDPLDKLSDFHNG